MARTTALVLRPGPAAVLVSQTSRRVESFRSEESRPRGRSVGYTVRDRGLRSNVNAVRPHGICHAAITEALEATGGNARAVQKVVRHGDLRVLTVYDDSRSDMAGEVAALVAGEAVA